MLSFTRNELEEHTKSLCTPEQYRLKLQNYKSVEQSFAARAEHCDGLPVILHVEPSGNCNLACPICPRGQGLIERTGFLSMNAFRRFFDPLSETLSNMIVSGFGEPLLNPDVARMIRLAGRHGIATLMNTNGIALLEKVGEILDSRLTRINISMDGAVSTSCHRYTAENPFSRVVQGVERLRTEKDKGNCAYPRIRGQFIVTVETVDEVAALRSWALGIGLEEVNFKRRHEIMPGEKDREEIFAGMDPMEIVNTGKVVSAERLHWAPGDCTHPWDSLFLSCTGEAGICSFDPYLSVPGLNHGSDFAALWNGNAMKRVRRWHAGGNTRVQAPCSKCNRLPGYLVPGG